MKAATKDFDSLMEKLQEQHDKASVDMYLPSLQEVIKAKKITVEQQTQILTGALTQETQQNVFSYNRVISEIILKNCKDPEDINLIDKIPLAIQFRIDTIGETLEIEGIQYNIKDHINSVYPLVESRIRDTLAQQEHTTDTGINIIFTCPPLYIDFDVNKSAEEKWTSLQGEEIVSELFKVEISKYIQQINFQDESINVHELNFDERMKVCNLLPMSSSKALVDYIEKVKDIETQYISISGSIIPMNASLFGA